MNAETNFPNDKNGLKKERERKGESETGNKTEEKSISFDANEMCTLYLCAQMYTDEDEN